MLRDVVSCYKIQGGLLTEKCVGWTTLKGIIHEAGDIMKNPASLKSYTLNDLVELPHYYAFLIYEFGGKECINIHHLHGGYQLIFSSFHPTQFIIKKG